MSSLLKNFTKVKFEKYLSSDTTRGNLKLPNCLKGDIYLSNSSNMTPGIMQRLNVQPDDLLLSKNKNRIGIHINGGRNYALAGDWANLPDSDMIGRKICIFQKEQNQMQSTPYISYRNYVMEIEKTGFSRSHAMLWGFCSNDPYHRWGDRGEINFPNMDAAYFYARSIGSEVDMIYPHERYHETKSYTDNFRYNEEYPEDIDSMDDINIDYLEKKL